MPMQNLTVISSYPRKNITHDEKVVGGATYTKGLITSLKQQNPSLNIEVLSEKFDRTESYTEEGIKIKREWKRGNLLSLTKLFVSLLFSERKDILTSFEAFMFGKPIITAYALAWFVILRLMGKNNYFLLHQVLQNFDDLEPNKLKAKYQNFQKNLLYKLILIACSKVLVFEEQFRQYLGSNNPKIEVLPHFVPNLKRVEKIAARKKLGLNISDFYVLYFGFLAPYKGVDLLVKNWPKKGSAKLILAGGENPNHADEAWYKKYVSNVLSLAKQKGIKTTGFVKESEIPYYFEACDVVIFPYRTFMSSSGPLSFAYHFEKGVLLSKRLTDYSKSEDFKLGLKRSGLKVEDLTFDFNSKGIKKAINTFTVKKEKFVTFSKYLKEARTNIKIANLLFKQLTEQSQQKVIKPSFVPALNLQAQN